MEHQFFENPCSPASQLPENLFSTMRHCCSPSENYPRSPLITYLPTSNEALESAFTGLSLSPNPQTRSRPPPFLGREDAVVSSESVLLPRAFGENQQYSSIWAQAQTSNAGANGPFCFAGAHQRINGGPEAIGFSGRTPYLFAGDHDMLMTIHAGCDSVDRSVLHGKEPLSRNNFDLPLLPSVTRSNFRISGPSVYSDEQFYNQTWCSILDLNVEEGLTEEEFEIVLTAVVEFSAELMWTQAGSQFVLRLFAVCNEDQRTRFIMALTRFPFKFITLCLNSYGARTIQKLLEKLIKPQQIWPVVSALKPGAVALSTDSDGQHVVHYCVRNFSSEYVKYLLIEIAENCFKIAVNKSGCCVLQWCVEHSHGEVRRCLMNEIIINAVHLAEDPYGNYVVQHLLGMKMPEVTADLIRQLQGHFMHLSCNKYASNVVEKLLLESGEHHSSAIAMELVKSPNASMLLFNPFGNFVIQSALSVSKGAVHEALLELIQINASSMQSNLYGKKILSRLEKRQGL